QVRMHPARLRAPRAPHSTGKNAGRTLPDTALEADDAGADLWWPIADLDDGPAPWWKLTGTKP
ncbi:hypothetical protein, partial [Kitasatospora sp. NPDC058218]|uniref:hypothetical protein n=1 Tax=Kitasatospora sp. NPDC058218 TaxID=3346385 RepID=UPI0036D7B33E